MLLVVFAVSELLRVEDCPLLVPDCVLLCDPEEAAPVVPLEEPAPVVPLWEPVPDCPLWLDEDGAVLLPWSDDEGDVLPGVDEAGALLLPWLLWLPD